MKPEHPILIFECANAHGGDAQVLKQTITRFAEIDYPEKHIKFQPLHPDRIALPDFSAYGIYQELFFEEGEWADIIDLADSRFDGVWLDIFDSYGVDILSRNIGRIAGIKLQSSVLENYEVITRLKDLSLSDTRLMINISGHELPSIERFAVFFAALEPAEIVLQLGFQDYPTRIEDTGLNKIAPLRAAFPGLTLCLADHAPAEDDLATIVPLLGVAAGCAMVEKHICLDRTGAKYDFHSALHPDEMRIVADRLAQLPAMSGVPFISDPEKNYLATTVQVPVAAHDLPEGSTLAFSDLIYRRTAQAGEPLSELMRAQGRPSVLGQPIGEGQTINASQFRPAKVGVIVACRMKSSRLKNKAVAPIAGRPSVERCLENCLMIDGADLVVLATSTLEDDAGLEDYTLDGRTRFWQGDPDDVIQRYLGACEAFGIDVVIRVTADCPVVSPEIAAALLERHFTSGADYTVAAQCAVGSGTEIINREALQRVIDLKGGAQHSEYMTWYFQNNTHIFKVETVDLPGDLVRDYRLTLDYPEDLELFSQLYERLARDGRDASLKNVFAVLDGDEQLANVNRHLSLSYRTDHDLISRLNKETKIDIG
ncbi:cytidylyltransferase domain-containing protein [Hoeflea prorocentri]|uniref:N-acetylneuraminate synthase family protein n=1 Tax=Hoeflea prorocentri TaxID=1922333 RepID=A0A9X3UMU9_9HYPH|nr:N-acetylneuraminate synthase family protein [Hoeflea prorocentri]MCY6383770.1 N-acetylneuraminate synthase family protein [Hoeflea prorocentri]MDA5401570.1 N-acetylneuraminate synthase family protein [Hoeflea prorocentri]